MAPESASKLAFYSSDLHPSPKDSLELAARLDVRLLQLAAFQGELAPERLTQSGRRHLLRIARQLGLGLVALGADLSAAGRGGSDLDRQVAQTCRILELARDLNVPLVSATLGRPQGEDARSYDRTREALVTIAEHADLVGCPIAIETAVDSPAVLSRLLGEVRCEMLKVCYDPGALMISGLDPLAPIEAYANHIALSHVRDALVGNARQAGCETVLGQGQLDLALYLSELREAGYCGPQVLRRSHSQNPLADAAAGKAHFERAIAAL